MGVRMRSTLLRGHVRRVGVLGATSVLCWAGFVAVGSAAYGANQGTNGNAGGNSESAHANGHGNDDSKTVETTTTTDSSGHSTGTAGTSGDPTQPQPLSNADQNSGGANGQCPGGAYCSTRDGSASGNGNGNGKATGKPCAGCVGKADNKNPKGQQPGGSDHNAGYECDRNHGIGRTNPAHTGCTSGSTPPPPPCSSTSTTSSDDCTPPPGCTPSSAHSADCDGTPPVVPPSTPPCTGGVAIDGACVSGETFTRQPPAGQQSSADPSVLGTSASGVLPFTGSPVGELLGLGIAALLVGTAGVVAGRRPRSA